MAEAKETSKSATPPSSGGDVVSGLGKGPAQKAAPVPVTFKNVWPIPVLGIATAMLVGGAALFVVSNRQKPDPSLPLKHALELVEAGKYEEGLEALNGPDVLRYVDYGEISAEKRAEYHLAMARSLFGAQSAKGLSVGENYRSIVRQYTDAQKLGAKIDQADVIRLAESHLEVGETEKALQLARSITDADGGAERRSKLIKRIIQHNMASSGGHTDAKRQALTLELLASLASDPELSSENRAWVLARQSELLLDMGQYDEAIGKLIRRIGLLRDVPTELRGELHILLGRAYLESGQPEPAARQLEAAESLVDRGSQLRADMNVMLGRIAQNAKDYERASERFSAVIAEFPNARALLSARLGLAEVESAIAMRETGHDEEKAIEQYAALIEDVRKPGNTSDVTRENVLDSLMRSHAERYNSTVEEGPGAPDPKARALRYAMLAETLFADNQTPAELLLAIGRTQRDLADDLLAQSRAGKSDDFRIDDLDPTTRAEVKQRYMQAGEYLRRHAQAVAASDPAAYSASLWTAADSFDLAGDLDEAKKSFGQYADGASDNDPQKPAAKFRLAQVFQAKRDFPAAIAIYETLIAARGAPGTISAAGEWADRSIVPMAQCLFDDGNPANDAEADRLLTSIVDGSTLSPDAGAYRDALIHLGSMSYTAGKYPEAIGWLEQAASRYADDRRIDSIRYRLGDSHRLEAQRIGKTLETKLPQSQMEELTSLRTEHLRAASAIFQQVRESLEGRTGRALTALEKIYVRNAYFYAGDCLFDLKDYDGAIAAYDLARLRYTDDPSSLVAMAQIVSAYATQGKWAQARTANERARQQLARFPDEVWSRPDLPMEKHHWEKWLEARSLLEQAATAEGNSGGEK